MASLLSVNAIVSACAPVMKLGPPRQASHWPAYLETLNPDPRPLWHVDMGRGARGSPALGEAVIAVGTADRNLVLLDRASGDILWRSHLDGTVRAGPLLDEDRLYVATESQPQGRIYAVRLRDGRRLWRARTGSVAAPLTYDGEALYAGTEEGLVLRVEPERGQTTWRTHVSGAVRAGPVITPAGLVVATTTDTLYLLDRQSGSVRSRLALAGTVLATPATDGRRVYVATTNGRVVAVDLTSWTIVWDRAAGDAVYGTPALVGDTLFVLSRAGQLWRIPVDAPDAASSHALDIVATAGPTPLASGVLVGSVSGEVLLVDPASGAIRWRAQVTGPIEEPPLVRDRQVVVVAGRGNIYSYR